MKRSSWIFHRCRSRAVNSDYIGSVNWGDGTVVTPLTSGNIVAVSTSSAGVKFAVYGNHTYTEFGTYHVTINVTDDGGNPSMTSARGGGQ